MSRKVWFGKEKSKEITLVTIAIAGVLLLAGLVFLLPKKIRVDRLKQSIPSYFLQSGAELQITTKTPQENPPLLPQDILQAGLSYEINTPYAEAAGNFLDAMQKNGWYPVFGSDKSPDKTVVRLNNGKETLLGYVEPVSASVSRITIFPVKNK